MQKTQITIFERINLEWLILILTSLLNIGIFIAGLALFLEEEIFSQIIGILFVIAFLVLLYFEFKFYKNNPWGWYALNLAQIFLLISLIFIGYSQELLDLMNSLYLIVIKGFSEVLINLFIENPEYDFAAWIEDVLMGENSFFTNFGVLIGSLFTLLGIYWVNNYLNGKFSKIEEEKVKKQSIIAIIVFCIMIIVGFLVYLSTTSLNIVFGGFIGSSSFVLLLILMVYELKEELKIILSKIIVWVVLVVIALFSGDIFVAIVILICFVTYWLLHYQPIQEKFDTFWTPEQREERIAITLIIPTAAVVILIVLVPVIWAILASFFDIGLRNLGPYGKPAEFVFLDNFMKFFRDDEFYVALRTTLFYTILGTCLSVFIGLIAAILINRQFRGRGVIRGIMLFPYISSTMAIILLWRWALNPSSGIVNAILYQLGIIDAFEPWLSQTPWAFIICVIFEAWKYFPFAMLMILARLQAINQELYEAADIDGANEWQKFWNITLPELRYVLGVVFLLRAIWTFNKFDDVYLFTGGSIETGTLVLPVYIFDKVWTGVLFKVSEATAVAVVLLIGLIAFVILFGKKVLQW